MNKVEVLVPVILTKLENDDVYLGYHDLEIDENFDIIENKAIEIYETGNFKEIK